MNINKLKEKESETIRRFSRLAIFNQKRFWLQEDEQQQTQDIEEEFNKLSLNTGIVTQKQNLRKFCKQFQSFDYYQGQMVDINEYYIRILPFGQRCIVSAYQGITVIKTINGNKYKFNSCLPGGSSDSYIGRCILDCILSANTIYIYDIIQWGKTDMSEQIAEFRYFWIKGNILNILDKVKGDYTFKWIPVIPSLQDVSSMQFPYLKHGLLFVKKDSYYLGQVNPECILYKDQNTDDYFMEKLAQYKSTETITLTLSLFKDELSTRDGHILGKQTSNTNCKTMVDVEFKGKQIKDIREPSKYIEDPYSKLLFWSILPKLQVIQ